MLSVGSDRITKLEDFYSNLWKNRRPGDDIRALAMQYDGPDHNQLDRTLAGFAKHPNVAAYILVGIGLELAI